MAKRKKEIVLKDCSKCTESFTVGTKRYCNLKLQDKKVLKDSGIVTSCECIYFRYNNKNII